MSFLARIFGELSAKSSDAKNAKPSTHSQNDRYTRLPMRLRKYRGTKEESRPAMNIGAPTNFRHVNAFDRQGQRVEAHVVNHDTTTPQRHVSHRDQPAPSSSRRAATLDAIPELPQTLLLPSRSEEERAPAMEIHVSSFAHVTKDPVRRQLSQRSPLPHPPAIARSSEPVVRSRLPQSKEDRLELKVSQLELEVQTRQKENLLYLKQKLVLEKRVTECLNEIHSLRKAQTEWLKEKATTDQATLVVYERLRAYEKMYDNRKDRLPVTRKPPPQPLTPPKTPLDLKKAIDSDDSVSIVSHRATVDDSGGQQVKNGLPSSDDNRGYNSSPVQFAPELRRQSDGPFFDALDYLE